MRSATITALTAALQIAVPAGPAAAPARTIVVCSPGSPGNSVQAQPTMDAFAAAAAKAAGWPPGSLAAVYHETADAGLARFAQGDAAIAMVPLPFFVRHGLELGLEPKLEAVPEPPAGEDAGGEVWALVARKGAVSSPASLGGWEVTGAAGYAPSWVRSVVLGPWGALPADARVTFTPRVLGALRRAAAGEKVAALLDRAQVAALASLPFAADLEVVTRSRPLPGALLCTVGDRLPAREAATLAAALVRLGDHPEGREVLDTMRLKGFSSIDAAGLEAVRRMAAP